LSACDELQGNLSVSKPIVLKLKKDKMLTLAPGSYSTEVEVDSKDREIEVEVKVGEKKHKTKIKIPGTDPLPTYNGSLKMSAAEIGQSFDLSGVVDTETDETSPTRATESCTYYVRERVCHIEREPAGPNGEPGREVRVCNIEDVAHTGSQHVEYHYETTTTTGDMMFLEPGTLNVSAQFHGSRSVTHKIYDYTGECFGRGW
jgi:hypothetical protein